MAVLHRKEKKQVSVFACRRSWRHWEWERRNMRVCLSGRGAEIRKRAPALPGLALGRIVSSRFSEVAVVSCTRAGFSLRRDVDSRYSAAVRRVLFATIRNRSEISLEYLAKCTEQWCLIEMLVAYIRGNFKSSLIHTQPQVRCCRLIWLSLEAASFTEV